MTSVQARTFVEPGKPLSELPRRRGLHSACSNNNIEVASELLRSGVPVNKQNKLGLTPLMGAAFFGHEQMIKLLLQWNAAVNIRCSEGATALVYAIAGNHKNVVELLLDHGADRDVRTTIGLTAAQIAANMNNPAIYKLVAGRDIISILPEEIALYIVSLLDTPSLLAVSLVNRKWNKLANDRTIWHRLCKRHVWVKPQMEEVARQYGLNVWKVVYAERNTLERNWRQRRFVQHVMHGHSRMVMALAYNDDVLVTASKDGTLIKWNQADRSSAQVLKEHHSNVFCVVLHPSGYIISGHENHDIVLWSHGTSVEHASRALHVVRQAHTDCVTCLNVDGQRIVSGSFDERICFWEVVVNEKGEPRLKQTNQLVGHHGDIYCLKLSGNTVISAGADGVCRVWNVALGTCVRNLKGHKEAITCVDFNDEFILTGSLDETVRISKRLNGELFAVLDHGARVRCMQYTGNRLVVGCLDIQKPISVWYNPTSKSRQLITLSGPKSLLHTLQFDETKIVAGSQDNQVYVWDFSVDTNDLSKSFVRDHLLGGVAAWSVV